MRMTKSFARRGAAVPIDRPKRQPNESPSAVFEDAALGPSISKRSLC